MADPSDAKLSALGNLYASMTDGEMGEMFDETGHLRPMDMGAMFADEDEAWEVVNSMKDSNQKLVRELVDILGNSDVCNLLSEEQERLAERAIEIMKKIPAFDPNLKLLEYGETLLYGAVSNFHRNPCGVKLVQALLDHGADPSLGNNMDGETALDFLIEGGENYLGENENNIVGLLRDRGAKTYVQQQEELLQARLATQREEAKGKCANCGELESSSAQKLSRCTGCEVVYYCGRKCQKAHWKVHKSYCKRIKSIEK